MDGSHPWLHASHVMFGQRQREQPPFIKISTCTKNSSIDLCDSHERYILQMRTLRFRKWFVPTVVKYWARSRIQFYCLSKLIIWHTAFWVWVEGGRRNVFRVRSGQGKEVVSVYSESETFILLPELTWIWSWALLMPCLPLLFLLLIKE